MPIGQVIIKFIATVLPALLLAACVSTVNPIQGTLSGNLRWQGKVYLAGDVVLERGARLVIAPGTEVIFLPSEKGQDHWQDHPNFPGSELIVRGLLLAEGTSQAPITFRYADPDAPAGSWGGINIESSPEARFRYCRFSQADSALHSRDSLVFVEESVFENNLVGIRFHSTKILVEKNLLRHNRTAIRFHFGAPVICKNDILDNERGVFITSHPRDYLIEGNNILGSREYSVIFGEEVPEDVTMARNYWGTADPAAIEATFYDGRRESYLGRIRFQPLAERPVAGAGVSWNP